MLVLKQSNLLTLKDGVYPDGNNLYFRVRNQGKSREFLYRCTIKGRPTYRSLGTVKRITLKEARQLAKVYIPEPAKSKITLDEAYKEALEIYARQRLWKTKGTSKRIESLLQRFVLPSLGNRKICSITAEDIVEVILPLWTTKHVTAERILSNLRGIFKIFMVKEYCTKNPCEWKNQVELFLPPSSKVHTPSHYPFIPPSEMPDAFKKIFEYKESTQKSLVMFVILSALRVSEAASLQWSYIKEDKELGRYFDIPAENRKGTKKSNHRLPITPYMELLLSKITRTSEYVFTSSTSSRRKKHIDVRSATRLFHERLNLPCTFHGFRSSFRSWSAENSLDPDASELILSHEIGSKVSRAYLRTDLYHKRKEILIAWNEYLFSKIDRYK